MANQQDLDAAIADVGQKLTDLQASVANEKTQIDQVIADLKALGTIPDANIQSLLAISASLGSLKGDVDGLVTPQ